MLLAEGEVQVRGINVQRRGGMVLTISSMVHIKASFLDGGKPWA